KSDFPHSVFLLPRRLLRCLPGVSCARNLLLRCAVVAPKSSRHLSNPAPSGTILVRGGLRRRRYSTTRKVALARATVSPSAVTSASTKPIDRPAFTTRGVICSHCPTLLDAA